jgi:outer membrane protein TolC
MRKLILFFISVTLCADLLAQTQPGTVRARIDTTRLSNIRERLVQLALQNPEFEIADRNVAITQYQLKAAKGDWLGFIQPQVNLNPMTLYPPRIGNQYEQMFFPIWNVAIAMPLNFYSQRNNILNVATQKIIMGEAEKNDRYRRIRSAVLSAFEDYRMYSDMLDIQNRIMLDERLDYLQAEKDFADGELDAALFKRAKLSYAEAEMRQREMQRNLETSKIVLEQMVGVSIDDVIGRR